MRMIGPTEVGEFALLLYKVPLSASDNILLTATTVARVVAVSIINDHK
jgi:hypothetical protein